MLYLMAWLRLLVRPSQNPHAVIALDHGPIFRLCEVCESSLGNEKNSSFQNWWKRMLHQWASTLDYIIWLDAPDSNLLERIQKRERWHSIKLQSKPEAFEFLIRSRACLKNVLGKMTVEGKAKVLYFDTSFQTTDQIARQILEAFDHTTVHPISQS
jgi:deoxyadenosine/deoxycytidine kinase